MLRLVRKRKLRDWGRARSVITGRLAVLDPDTVKTGVVFLAR